MTLYEGLKALHVLVVAGWLGGGIVQYILVERARRRSAGDGLAFAREAEFLGSRYFPLLALGALVTGIGLIIDGDLSFGDLWITLALAGWLVSGVLGGALMGPTLKKLFAQSEAGDPAAPGTFARFLTLVRVDILILALVVVDMVVKPGG
jgi:uncharacterized membrane protein